MDSLFVYRGVKDVTPDSLEVFFPSQGSSGQVVGEGMYFAFNYDEAKSYIKGASFNKFSVVGHYYINGDYKIFNNQNHEKDKKMKHYFNILKEADSKINELQLKVFGKNLSLPEGAIEFLSQEELTSLLKEQERKIEEFQSKIENISELRTELRELMSVRGQIVEKINERRKESYDISIMDYIEVCVHNQNVKFKLEKFDLYLKDEETAQQIYSEIRDGELNGSEIKNISGDIKDKVSYILSKL